MNRRSRVAVIHLLALSVVTAAVTADADALNDGERRSVAVSAFTDSFVPRGMRLDLIHSGTADSERYSLDQVREEPFWGGRYGRLTDFPDYGKYRVSVYAMPLGRLIYRYGYSSLFGEWQTTAEAASGRVRAIEEAVRFPMPRRQVRVVIASRKKDGRFEDVYSVTIDPGSREVDRGRRFDGVEVLNLEVNGPPESVVDVLILGDGYTEGESAKFNKDARRFLRVLFQTSPFKEMRQSFAVRAIRAPSAGSGPDEPRRGIFTDTGLSTTFDTFGSARYLTSTRSRDLRDLAALAPYDTLIVMVNTSRYGGGGIFGLYSVFASDNEFDEYIMTHEFGHGFAGLGDEYYSSSVAYSDFYPRGVEPWEPNLTALLKDHPLKWRALVDDSTPIPTPPDRARYGNVVGAFEGAGYSAKGLYRPAMDCKMFSKGNKGFCPVCKAAVEDMIRLLTSPGG
ncbi:MAG: peptidase M64 [Deltaproteobacteria bacterium]|nr:peptidase M64 [Deltaproteobacteria bacterium]